MAATPSFKCVCGVQKKSSNHWILATHTPDNLTFRPWDTNLALRGDVTILCGEGCAAALLSRSLGEWKQPAFSDDSGELVVLVASNGSREVVFEAENVDADFTAIAAEGPNELESVDDASLFRLQGYSRQRSGRPTSSKATAARPSAQDALLPVR